MKLSARIAVVALAGVVVTGTAYKLQGSRVEEKGVRREPLALIPPALSWRRLQRPE